MIRYNEQNKATEPNDESIKDKECIIDASSIVKLETPMKIVSKSICKIKAEIITGKGIENKIWNGFFLKFYIDQEMFYCLVSNEYSIDKDTIQNNIIDIYNDCKHKIANLIR